MYRRNLGALGASFQPTHQPFPMPACVGGVNSLDSLMQMPPIDCIYTYNMMPVERGMVLRDGYREWTNGAGTGDVRTMIPYESQKQSTAQDRLWAVTTEGIYDVSTFSDTSPTKDVTFSVTTGDAGYGVFCEFTNDASDHYLFYADAENGLHQYKEGTGWSVPTGWTKHADSGGGAFPVSDVVFVAIHKLRIWVILKDSDDAWYLPVESISGELRKFTFGAKMNHGGNLVGLWTWSVDGGAGVDDFLIGIGRGGDVLLYQGSDPSQADFGTVGSWFVGVVPASSRIVLEYGSEMYLLSSYGITALKDLLAGVEADALRSSPSAKVNKFLRADIATGIDSAAWSMAIHPASGFLQVVTPKPTNTPYLQYTQTLSTKAWGFWSNVPALCAATWRGEYYMGGEDGIVWQSTGTVDGTMLDGTLGEDIEWDLLTAFQASVIPTNYKRVGLVRTNGILSGNAPFTLRAVYDYELTPTVPSPGGSPESSGSTWNSSVWDASVWDYTASGISFMKGTLGVGRVFAVAMKGTSTTGAEIIGWDVSFTRGGFM